MCTVYGILVFLFLLDILGGSTHHKIGHLAPNSTEVRHPFFPDSVARLWTRQSSLRVLPHVHALVCCSADPVTSRILAVVLPFVFFLFLHFGAKQGALTMLPVGRQGAARRPGLGPAGRHALPAPVCALFSRLHGP